MDSPTATRITTTTIALTLTEAMDTTVDIGLTVMDITTGIIHDTVIGHIMGTDITETDITVITAHGIEDPFRSNILRDIVQGQFEDTDREN